KRVEDPFLDQRDEVVQETRARLTALLEEVEPGPLELLAEDEIAEAFLRGDDAARHGVDASDERPDARPDDEIDRDLVLFQDLQDPDMGQPARRAAAQGQADLESFEHLRTTLVALSSRPQACAGRIPLNIRWAASRGHRPAPGGAAARRTGSPLGAGIVGRRGRAPGRPCTPAESTCPGPC